MTPRWKPDWAEARRRIQEWWDGKGFIVGTWGGIALSKPHANLPRPGMPASLEQQWTDIPWRAEQSRRQAAWTGYPLETLPVADPWFGPGSLALYLGAQPGWGSETVWYKPCIGDPDTHPPLCLDPANFWWKAQIELVEAMLAAADGDYFVGTGYSVDSSIPHR